MAPLFDIEAITGRRVEGDQLMYRIKWVDIDCQVWMPFGCLESHMSLILEFELSRFNDTLAREACPK